MQRQKNIIIIGSGISSLSSACYLAKNGYKVRVLEKNNYIGGRARLLKKQGFTFDMGPTFYWMPDVFESFFADFNKQVSDYYELKKLNPAYRVYFSQQEKVDIPDSLEKIIELFESLEAGGGRSLQKFIKQAESNYKLVMRDFVYKPSENIFEIISLATCKKLGLFFRSIKNQIAQNFTNPSLRKILEFPTIFLGAPAAKTPAFYNFMNYADFGLGTWHPVGGMYCVVQAMQGLATSLGVEFHTNSEVTAIVMKDAKVQAVKTANKLWDCDLLLSGADYVHTESLLPQKYRQYSVKYW